MTFRQQQRISAIERKDKRRGMTYSILFHAALFLIMWLVSISSTDRSDEMAYIEIVFEQPSGASAPEAQMAEASDAAPDAPASAEEIVDEEIVDDAPEMAEPVEPIEVQQPEAQPEPADVVTDLTTSDFSEIVAREREQQPEPEPVEEIVEEEIEELIEEQPEPEPIPEPQPRPTPTPRETTRETPQESPRTRTSPAEFPRPTPGRSATESSNQSADDGQGDSQARGSSDRASSTAGSGRTANPRGGAGGEDRSQWSGFQGTGPLQRPVVQYGDSKQLAGGPGVIMIRLCIDRNGRIVFQEINRAGTTIEDVNIQRRALDIMSTYVFDTDQSAPYRECGNYTFRLTPAGN